MSIDAYTPCPGGTGKKVKFCCGGDFLAELQKIDRMLEGQQFLACLHYLEGLLGKERARPRACLLATKCLLLRLTDQFEAARQSAGSFWRPIRTTKRPWPRWPFRPPAKTRRPPSISWSSAMEAAAGEFEPRTYSALGQVAAVMLYADFVLPARALLRLQADTAPDDKRAQSGLAALCRSRRVPLLLRDEPPLGNPPGDAPWKDRWIEAWQTASVGCWRTAAEQLAQLAAEAPDAAAVWRDLATLRGWLAQNQSAIEALRKYAALRAVEPDGLDNAVEAEATAMCLSDDPFGDRSDVFRLVWTVRDADALNDQLLSSPLVEAVRIDLERWPAESSPPPKAAYSLLHRPAPAAADGLAVDALPPQAGRGRALVWAADRPRGPVRDGCGGRRALGCRADHPRGGRRQHRRRAPARGDRPAFGQPQAGGYGRLAAGGGFRRSGPGLDDRVRPQCASEPLARPETGRAGRPVAARGGGRAGQPAATGGSRDGNGVDLGGFSLGPGFRRAAVPAGLAGPGSRSSCTASRWQCCRPCACRGFWLPGFPTTICHWFSAAPMTWRFEPSNGTSPRRSSTGPASPVRRNNCWPWRRWRRTEEDVSEALRYCDQGRREVEAKGLSNVAWDLMELSFQCIQRNGPAAMRLIEHIQKRHIEEPGVADSLMNLLVQMGVLQPDGTPAVGPEAEPALATAEEPAAEPAKLWTPDSAQPGGGKLWTPE